MELVVFWGKSLFMLYLTCRIRVVENNLLLTLVFLLIYLYRYICVSRRFMSLESDSTPPCSYRLQIMPVWLVLRYSQTAVN